MSGAKKKAYGVVIGIGVCALLADQLLSSRTPAKAAGAVTAAAPTRSASSSTVAEGGSKLPPLAVMAFPNHLSLPVSMSLRRDPFSMSDSALAVLAPVEPESPEGEGAEPEEAEVLLQQRRLSAVMHVGPSRTAVLDGLIMSEGQGLDGCTLVRIAAREVQFDCSGEIITLTLRDPLSAAPGK